MVRKAWQEHPGDFIISVDLEAQKWKLELTRVSLLPRRVHSRTLASGMVAPTFRVGLLFPVKFPWKFLQGCSQLCISSVALNPVRLTMKINHHYIQSKDPPSRIHHLHFLHHARCILSRFWAQYSKTLLLPAPYYKSIKYQVLWFSLTFKKFSRFLLTISAIISVPC